MPTLFVGIVYYLVILFGLKPIVMANIIEYLIEKAFVI